MKIIVTMPLQNVNFDRAIFCSSCGRQVMIPDRGGVLCTQTIVVPGELPLLNTMS